MAVHIIEFKARVENIEKVEALLNTKDPVFKGEDRQTDTYYNVNEGRLKLREGNIENALIWYNRPETQGHKHSEVLLHRHSPGTALKEILQKLHGVKIVVAKKRRIYFIENVKFHFDAVDGLGHFIEVEAIDESGEQGMEKIKEQCDFYAKMFGVKDEDYIAASYSDMLLEKQHTQIEFPEIRTERLLLRKILPDDINEIFRGFSNPEVIKHFGVSFSTLEATEEQMTWYADMLENDTGRCWAVCSSDNSIFYGVCTINFWKKEHRKAETGYWIFPEHWQNGIASEAMKAVVNFGFNNMGLHRLSAEVEPENTGSVALLQKLGFKKEATLQECEIKNDRFLNLDIYALLRTTHKN